MTTRAIDMWAPIFPTPAIADKVLLGTGWFLLGRSPRDVTDEFRALPVRPDVLDRWMYGNAARVLGLTAA